MSAAVPDTGAQDIGFTSDSLTLNGETVFTHTNVESAANLIVSATSGADEIVLAAAGDRFEISSTNGSFATITFDALDSDDSLTINTGDGDDSVTLNTSFSAALSLSGGDGSDSLDLGADTNIFETLAYGTDFESATGGGTVQDFIFNAYGADDNIAFGHLSLTALVAAPALGFVLGPVAAVAGIAGSVATDVIMRTPNTVTVTRLGDGTIQIVDDNWLSSSTVIVNPVGSLTINTGMSYLWAGDTVTIDGLGTVNFSLTVNAGKMNAMSTSPGEVVFSGITSFNGRDLTVTADTITVEDNASVATSTAFGAAGDITLNGHWITLGENAQLLAEGDSDGDILLSAVHNSAIWTPLVEVEVGSVGVTVESGSEIRGRDVTILASVEYSTLTSTSGSISTVESIGDTVLTTIEGLASLMVDVSVVVSNADIDIQSGSVISSRNFIAQAGTYSKASASPTASFLIGGAVSVVVANADVTLAGTVNASEDVLIQAITDQTVSTVASPSAIKGVAIGAAVSVIVSDATAQVTDDAVLNVGEDLYVMAYNIDRVLTKATSQTGKDGIAGVALAVTVEVNSVNAWLDGVANVGEDVLVSATMEQDSVPIKKLFALPSSDIGTSASAGTGSSSSGDVLDDVKSSATSPFSILGKNLWTKFSNSLKKDGPVNGPELPTDFSAKVDLAGSLAVAVDIQSAEARIGDSGTDGDDLNGTVDAGGGVSVVSIIASSPYVSASASTENNPSMETSSSKLSGSLAISVGVCLNTAEAYIGSDAVVDSGATLTVNAQTLNDYEFSWGVNLVDAWQEEADYTTDDGEVTVDTGEIVEVCTGHTGGGEIGTWYEYLGTIEDIDLVSEDFSDEARWSSINPTLRKAGNFGETLVSYLSGDFGFSNWIGNTWSQATASGKELSLAGAITFLELENTASALIMSGAQINQKENSGTDQDVVVSALSLNETVNLIGNIDLPSISVSADNPFSMKTGKDSSSVVANTLRLDKDALLPSAGSEGKSGVGVSLIGVDYAGKVTAKIEDGVQLYADSLQVTAENNVLGVNVGASGGKSENFGVNGIVGLNLVRNTTLAQIENGAVIEVGSNDVFDSTTTADEDNGSLVVTATDSTWLFNVLGGVSVSEGVGVGASVGLNIVVRDTQAVIGDLASDTSLGTRGSITSGGNVLVSAENSGVSAAIAVSGGVATGKAASETETSGSSSGTSNPGTGGTQGSNGSTQSNEDLSSWQGAWGNVLKEAKDAGKFTVNSDIANIADETSETTSGATQSKSGVGISASVAVNWADEDARAYILNTGAITLTDSTLSVEATNSTGVVSLAGGVAFAKSSGTGSATGFGGALGLNVLYGTTDAFIEGVSSLNLGALSLAADRTGWVVSLAAGSPAPPGTRVWLLAVPLVSMSRPTLREPPCGILPAALPSMTAFS